MLFILLNYWFSFSLALPPAISQAAAQLRVQGADRLRAGQAAGRGEHRSKRDLRTQPRHRGHRGPAPDLEVIGVRACHPDDSCGQAAQTGRSCS